MEQQQSSSPRSPSLSPTSRQPGQIALAVGVVVVGALLALGTTQLPEASGYAKVGPKLMPTLVSIGLLILGALLLKEALFGGFNGVDETGAKANPTDWRAFGWISAGILANGVLMVPVGFVFSGTLLFVLAARGFGDARWIKNTIIGLIISVSTYAFFTYGLGLGLPAGVLPW